MAQIAAAVGYVRVSTAEQVAGFSLGDQRARIKEYAKANGLRLIATLSDEGISGSNGLETRQGLAEAIAHIEAGEASVLVVDKFDRLARDLLLSETVVGRIRATGSRVVSIQEPDGGETDFTRDMVRQILGAVAQYERLVIRGRMMAGKAAKRAQGGYVGGQPGYGKAARDKTLVVNAAEAPIIEMVGRLRAEGRSYREIATALEEAGLRPRRASSWQPMVVRSIAMKAAIPAS
jgi:DNA invertase Pin-like site-specific DNA recombinase